MSVDDPDKKPLNQTRFGTPTGHANERQMLDSRNDTFGIRTIIRKNSEGSDTICRTHAGMPRFFTEEPDSPGQTIPSCPLTDFGFVNSTYSVGAYPPSEHFDWKLYNLFGSNGATKKAKYALNSSARKESLMWQAGSLFSGLMRRVAQLENGKYKGPKISSTTSLGEGESPFEPGFSVTDGLFLGTGNYNKPTRWVIRVQNSGVYRIPVTFCKELPTGWKDQEQIWLNTLSEDAAHAKIAPYWTVKKVAFDEAVKIGDAPPYVADGFGPFYGWCGWAFNYTGNAATIVCSGYNADDVGLRNRLYDMVIRDVAGVPTEAVFSLTEEGKFQNQFQDQYEGEGLAGLQAATTLPGYMTTYSFYHPSAVDQDTPVFSYYEEDGSKVVVRHYKKSGVSGVSSTTYQTPERCYYYPVGTFLNSHFDSALGYAVTDSVDPGPPEDSGYTKFGFGPYSKSESGNSGETSAHCYSPHFTKLGETKNVSVIDVSIEDSGENFTMDSAAWSGARWIKDQTLWCVAAYATNLYAPTNPYTFNYPGWANAQNEFQHERNVTLGSSVTKTYNETRFHRNVLLLHGFDRESYAVAEHLDTSTSVKTVARSNSFSGGSLYIPTGPHTVTPRMQGRTAVTPIGMPFEYDVDGADVSVGGWETLPSVIGSPVLVSAPGWGLDSAGTESATSLITNTMHLRVGGQSFEYSFVDVDVYNVVKSTYIMYRAASAAFKPERIVRSIEINGPLITESMGGIRPTGGITTFIGVF